MEEDATAMAAEAVQLIDGEGEFAGDAAERFMAAAGVACCGLSYAVVSIMGPQSSGKSTLLNQLFGTNFREMDAFRGRSQTTKGIWIARCVGVEPCTVVLDLEGTDGRERGEDDTAFEKQSALFALAMSDIVLINMWCHDIGREQAANKPLLKTVFQVSPCYVGLFGPCQPKHGPNAMCSAMPTDVLDSQARPGPSIRAVLTRLILFCACLE